MITSEEAKHRIIKARMEGKFDTPQAKAKRKKKFLEHPNVQRVLFKKGNHYWRLKKNTKMSEEQKIKLSMGRIGKKNSESQKRAARNWAILHAPMKDPFIKALHKKSMMKMRITKLENNTKMKYADLVNKMMDAYLSGWSILNIKKMYNIDRSTVSKILKENGVSLNRTKYKRFKYDVNHLNNSSKAPTDQPTCGESRDENNNK